MTVSTFPTARHGYDFAAFSSNDWNLFATEMDAHDAEDAARSPYAPDFVVEQCAAFPAGPPRAAVARRADVGKYGKALVRDKDSDVLEGLAANPHSPRWVLSDLMRHGSPLVAEIAARNPAAPSDDVDAYLLRKYSH